MFESFTWAFPSSTSTCLVSALPWLNILPQRGLYVRSRVSTVSSSYFPFLILTLYLSSQFHPILSAQVYIIFYSFFFKSILIFSPFMYCFFVPFFIAISINLCLAYFLSLPLIFLILSCFLLLHYFLYMPDFHTNGISDS